MAADGNGNGKVVVNLATGLEDSERVTVAFLVGGFAEGVACDGGPPLGTLFRQYAENGGELLVCPICAKARNVDEASLVANARVAGATPLWEWIGGGAGGGFLYLF